MIPIAEGVIDASHIQADLTDLARGAVLRTEPVGHHRRSSPVGMAYEDLVVARAALDALG